MSYMVWPRPSSRSQHSVIRSDSTLVEREERRIQRGRTGEEGEEGGGEWSEERRSKLERREAEMIQPLAPVLLMVCYTERGASGLESVGGS